MYVGERTPRRGARTIASMKPAPLSSFRYFARDCARLARNAQVRSAAEGLLMRAAQRSAETRWEGDGGSLSAQLQQQSAPRSRC